MRSSIGRHRGRHSSQRPSFRRPTLVAVVALALMAALIGVAGTAEASSVSGVTFSGSTLAANTTATWTTTFTTTGNGALPNGNTITVTFASGFVVPSTFTPTVKWGSGSPTTACTGSTGAGNQAVATVTVGGCNGNLGGGTQGIPKASAISVLIPGVTNAGPGTYANTSFSVKTQQDTGTVSPSSGVTLYGAASKLAFTTTMANATAGATLSPQPIVEVQDSGGRTVLDSSASVTIAVTGGGAALTCSSGLTVAASSGIAQFAGCSMTAAGTYTLTATSSGLASATSNSFVISAASASKLAFVQAPSGAFAGTVISPTVTVQVQDQYNNPASSSGVNVTMSASAGSITGTTASTNTSGLASFTTLTYGATVLGTTLTASASGLTSATSSSFNVTVNVTSAANALTTNATDAGAGVQSVSYYYCAGLSGACTNGTLIGSSSAGGSYQVNWTTRPVAGSYRVVAIATDKVGNASAVSGSTPVTVS